ncbi:uncharacterized protein LOC144663376 [Oculina patagonica]
MPTKIDELEELEELLELMKSFRLSTRGIKGVDGMKANLREYLKDLEGTSRRKVGETFQVLSEAGKTDARKRGMLCKLYEEAAEFFKQLDEDFIMQNLQESLGDFKTTMDENLKNIKPREQYVVLVAGETSAGKSSIINLILGEDLLPYSILSTTSTICELKYGEKPAIRVHFKDGGEKTREPFYRELGHSSETYKEEIEGFVHLKDDREKGSYKKIELFWPHPLFKEGIMIVDSPGVGESDVMNEFVLSYLPQAFCFIYVIKSSNAGGIQEDRLGVLLNYATKLKKEANMDVKLFASCALFVSNMWDQIPAENVEEVKRTQIEKLTKKLGDLDQQSQIIYLSCQRAQLAQTYGVITKDFDQLLTGINNLLISSMQTSLQIYSRWLEDVLSRASTQVRKLLKSTDMSRQEIEKRMKRVMDRMVELESSQDRIFDELSEYQLKVIKEIIEDLVIYFKSEETSNRFCKWSSGKVPDPRATWEETKSEVLKCISERAQQYVQEWEDEEHHFAKAQVALIKYFTEKYDIMEEEIRKVGEDVLFGEVEHESPTSEPPKPAMSRRNLSKKSIDVTTPVWFRQGLASVVVGTPFLGALTQKVKQSFQYKKKLERYKKDPFSYMEKRSIKCLKIIASEDRLLPFINGQSEDAVKFLVQIKSKIPRLREGDKKLYHQLLSESRSKFEIQGIYKPVSTRLEELKREITVFNVKEIRKSDFSSGELQWMEDESSFIGRGTFSTVYSGVLSCRGNPEGIKVALKVYSYPLNSNNVWHFIDEERALRELRHPNIVKFFGTNLQQSSCGTKVMVILELCDCSLKTRIMSDPENAPAHSEDVTVRKNVLLWAFQILDALHYVHDKKFVHRDLKLDNLLLTDENTVKLTDAGVAKREKDISGTMCGTLLYLAPEVFDGQTYDSKADMYSFGMILWEMWYAKTAFQTELTSRTQFQLLNDIREGLRPSHIGGTRQPWGMWQLVMETCWDKEPQHRLTAQQTRTQLEKLQTKTEKQSVSPSETALHSFPEDKLAATEPNSSPSKPQPTPKPRLAPKPQVAPKPRPAPKPNTPKRASVSFSTKTEDANVHFQ